MGHGAQKCAPKIKIEPPNNCHRSGAGQRRVSRRADMARKARSQKNLADAAPQIQDAEAEAITSAPMAIIRPLDQKKLAESDEMRNRGTMNELLKAMARNVGGSIVIPDPIASAPEHQRERHHIELLVDEGWPFGPAIMWRESRARDTTIWSRDPRPKYKTGKPNERPKKRAAVP